MNLAVVANDLQTLSRGRFMLGLGSQIRPHIEKRYSMTWSHPAARMREMVLAIRAIWRSWAEGDRLDFRGDFYRHTLMTPMFDPGPNPFGNPKIFVAAVGQRMTEAVGEVADGLLIHGFTTERYIREVTIPALERGLAISDRTRADFQTSYPGMVVTGPDEASLEMAKTAVKKQLAFYGSTPAYRPVLELHGWGDLQTELNSLSKQGKWDEMADLIDDEVVETFAVVASARGPGADHPAPLRRNRRPVLLLCPLRQRPRAVGPLDRRVQGLTGRHLLASATIEAAFRSRCSRCGAVWPRLA